jgi:hypothetical protein
VAFGSGQNVYTTFSATTEGGVETVLVARSSDGGTSFAVGVPALERATFPKLAVRPRKGRDRIYVASGNTATLARSNDGGRDVDGAVLGSTGGHRQRRDDRAGGHQGRHRLPRLAFR